MLPIGVDGEEIVVEGHQFEGILPILINAAGRYFLKVSSSLLFFAMLIIYSERP